MTAEEMSSLYDRDFFEWTGRVARLLREGRFTEVDVEHLAEEIEDVGKRDHPSLKRHDQDVLDEVYEEAVGLAIEETGLARECFPAECPYTFDQVMDFDFLPE